MPHLRPLLTRRQLLLSAAGAVVATVVKTPRSARAQPGQALRLGSGQAVRVLVHDEVDDGRESRRGHEQRDERQRGPQAPGVESRVMTSPFPFTHVGLHWQGGGPEAGFMLRTSADGWRWTAWQPLSKEAGPAETPAQETYAALVSAPKHRFAQYRAPASKGGAPQRVTATFLNSVDGPALGTPLAPGPKPAAITFTREDWGCDESLRSGPDGEVWARMFVPAKKLVVHHTASNPYTNAFAEVRAIYTYHARTLGWGDIGYNALVDIYGNSYEGRYGREFGGEREVFSPDVVAGHATGHNYGTCGVAAMGNFELDDQVPFEMVNRIIDVLTYQADLRGIDPFAASMFLQSNDGWTAGLANVCGHRDCTPTACPGQHLYPYLGIMRLAVAQNLARSGGPQAAGPNGESLMKGSAFYAWNGEAGKEYSYYLEGWKRRPASEDVDYLAGFNANRYPAWSPWSSGNTRASFSNLADGHYSLHVRGRDQGGGGITYETNKTILVSRATGNPPRREPSLF